MTLALATTSEKAHKAQTTQTQRTEESMTGTTFCKEVVFGLAPHVMQRDRESEAWSSMAHELNRFEGLRNLRNFSTALHSKYRLSVVFLFDASAAFAVYILLVSVPCPEMVRWDGNVVEFNCKASSVGTQAVPSCECVAAAPQRGRGCCRVCP